MEDFLTKEITCRLCGNGFKSLAVRRSKQTVKSTESDFQAIYERETPYFYYVFVCPNCGYAFMESFKNNPAESMQEKLTPLPDFFSEKRDAATAELAYKRALECARLQREKDAVLASLYLHMAWINRLRGEEEKEKANMAHALSHYIGVYESSDQVDISRVMYLIGELNRRLGNDKEAVQWFSRVVNDDNSSQAMRYRARQAWQALRQ
ncbi:MAG: DUF2225 domain-containing protein [Bacillota bacterium]